MDVQARVDLLLATPKAMAGTPKWVTTDREGQRRWLRTLTISGESTGLDLIIDNWPASPLQRVTVTLNYGRCISRLDAWEHDRHNNHEVRNKITPSDIELGWIFGPHGHLWAHNRHLGTPTSLPVDLEFAIKLPANVQGFENSFRWFCGQTNINCSADELPTLPQREYLI
ncbi:hypothetical protein [Methylobacterium sp. E-045]|uniref:hypothetical protein n=1 Tax=Methylobacterium sp. E-045 TaxID=2836575 RepID=UPI001FBACB17|nr:hypothetical protein [Methylobacterium sp. E-045]MCJ2128307.1 hypothetical protein [Methylobacterium sp. E-045]